MHFTAFARSKKGAEHAAAEKALDFIMSMGLLQAPTRNPPVAFLTPSPGMNDISIEEVRARMLGQSGVVTCLHGTARRVDRLPNPGVAHAD